MKPFRVSIDTHDFLPMNQEVVISEGYVMITDAQRRFLTLSLCENESVHFGFELDKVILDKMKTLCKSAKKFTFDFDGVDTFRVLGGGRTLEYTFKQIEQDRIADIKQYFDDIKQDKKSSEYLGLKTQSCLKRVINVIDTSKHNLRYNGAYLFDGHVYGTDGIVAFRGKADMPNTINEHTRERNKALMLPSDQIKFLNGSIRVKIKPDKIIYFSRNRIAVNFVGLLVDNMSDVMPPIDQVLNIESPTPLRLSKAFYPYYGATEHLTIHYEGDIVELSEGDIKKKFRLSGASFTETKVVLTSGYMKKILTKHCSPKETCVDSKCSIMTFCLGDDKYGIALRR